MPDRAHIVASAMRDPLRVAGDLGGDVRGICAAAAIDLPGLADPGSPVPLSAFVAFNQIAAHHLQAPDFGRVVGARFDFANIGEVGQAALAAPTLGAALRLMERAFIAVQGETELRLDVTGDLACLSYRILDPHIWPRNQDAELTMAVFRQLIARIAGSGWRPLELGFEHAASGAERRASGDAGCPVSYQLETNTLSFSAGLLGRPMPQRELHRYHRMFDALTATAQRIEKSAPLAARVRRLILKRLGSDMADQTSIARDLGLSRRSLRRHLAEEGTCFATLLGECREGRAKLLLRQDSLSTSEIADRLGYSEASGFERAFLRRTGQTPAAYRARAV
jgi:AraC-like DNA-binding protein